MEEQKKTSHVYTISTLQWTVDPNLAFTPCIGSTVIDTQGKKPTVWVVHGLNFGGYGYVEKDIVYWWYQRSASKFLGR